MECVLSGWHFLKVFSAVLQLLCEVDAAEEASVDTEGLYNFLKLVDGRGKS